MANQIKFDVGFEMDKQSIEQVKQTLQSLQNMTQKQYQNLHPDKSMQEVNSELVKMRQLADDVSKVFDKAFNAKLGTLNTATLNRELRNMGKSASELYADFSKFGAAGKNAFQQIATTALTTNIHLRETKTVLDKIGTTLGNTIKWNIASAAVNQMSGSIQEAYGYVKALDHSLNDIRIVTGKSAEDMDAFAEKANKAAKALGTSTTNYTKSALTFYQQGLNDEDVQARAELSNKVSNVTGLSGDQSAEYVTAVLNGYKVGSEEAEAAMDKLAAVAASTASDLAELSEGMSKVASAANAMGVTEDQLAATLSTVVSTTRQSASSVGTAFKTIYARIADIKAGSDEAEVSLGEYSGKMAELGFSVLDSEGRLKDLGVVMEEIGGDWKNLSREQQVSLAKTMAGTRQYNNLIALFDNWDEYMKALNVSMNSNGAIQEQQNIYMESTAAHLKQLKAAKEDLFDSFLDNDSINVAADSMRVLLDAVTNLVDALGGGGESLLAFGSIAMRVFDKQITQSVLNTTKHFKAMQEPKKAAKEQLENMSWFSGQDPNADKVIARKAEVVDSEGLLDAEEVEKINEALREYNDLLIEQRNLQNTETKANVEIDKGFLTRLGDATGKIHDGGDAYSFSNTLNPLTQDFSAEEFEEVEAKIVDATQRVLEETKITDDTFKKLKQSVTSLQDAEKQRVRGLLTEEESTKKIAEASATVETVYENNKDQLKTLLDLLPEGTVEYNNLSTAMANMNENTFQDANKTTGAVKQLEKAAVAAHAKIAQTSGLVNQAMANREAGGVLDQNAAALATSEQKWKDIKAAIDEVDMTQGIVRLTSGIGQVASGLNSVLNLLHIWDNENLSFGEKTLQTIMSVSMAVPMLINGISDVVTNLGKLKEGYAKVKDAVMAYILALMKETGLEKADITVKTVLKAVTRKLQDQFIALQATMELNPFFALVTALLAAVAAIKIIISIIDKYNEKQAEERKQTIETANAMNEKAAAAENAYKSYEKLYSDYAKYGQNEKELRDAILATAEAYGIQVSAMDLAAGNYDKINEKILKAKKEQTKDALSATQDGINASNKDIAMSGSTLGDDGSRMVSFDSGLMVDAADKAVVNILTPFVKEFGQIDGDTISQISENEMGEFYNAVSQAYQEMGSSLTQSDKESSEMYQSIANWLADNKEYFNNYNKLKSDMNARAQEFAEAQTALDSKGIESVDSFASYKEYKAKYIEELENAYGGKENIIYDKAMYDSVDDYLSHVADEYLATIDSIKNYAEASQISDELEDAMFGMFKDEPSEDKKAEIQAFLDGLSDEDLRLIATVGIDEQASEKQIKAALELAKAQAENSISDVPADAINTYLDALTADKKLNKSEQDAAAGAESEITGYLAQHDMQDEWSQVSQQGQLAQITFLQDLMSKQDEYATKTRESVEKELEAKQALDEARQQDIQDQLSDEFNIGDDENFEEVINKKIEDYQKLMEAAEEAGKEFDEDDSAASKIFGSKKEFERVKAQMEELNILAGEINDTKAKLEKGDFTFEMDMGNVDEILSVGDTILSEAEKMKQAAELIGEGFTVAAEDADKLVNVFPEILENAEVTADGVIHLDDGVVNELLGNQQEILNGDVTTAVAKIDNQIAVLESNKREAEAELFLANQVAKGKVEMTQEQAQIMADSTQQLTDYLIQLGLDENLAQQAAMEAMAGNIEEYDRITADVADNTANNLANSIASAANNFRNNTYNMKTDLSSLQAQAGKVAEQIAVMADGEVTDSSIVSGSGGGSVVKDFIASVNNHSFRSAEPVKTVTKKIDVKAWQDNLLSDISGYTNAIAQLTALKAKLLANQKNANDAMNGAASGAGGKPSKGSGGGKDKDDKVDFIEALEDESDTYHDINIQIEQLNKDFEELEKLQDRLTGKDLIKNLQDQLYLLEKQRKAYHDKIELAKMEADALKEILKASGATFDETGNISNYYSLLDKKLAEVNAVIGRYNNLTKDQQTEEEKDKVEKAKQDYENLKDIIDSYEDTINNIIPELEDQIEDALIKEIELKIEKFDMKIQLKLDMAEAEREWNNFKRKVIDEIKDDDIAGIAHQNYKDILSYYNTNNTGTGSVQAQTDRVNMIVSELQKIENGGHSDIYSAYDKNTDTWVDNKAAAIEDLEESYTNLMNDLESVADLEEDVRNNFLDSIDAVEDAYESQRDAYHFLEDQLTHDIELLELLYGDSAFEKMSSYYDKQIQGTKEMLAAEQKTRDYWKEKMIAEREAIANGAGDKDALQKYEDNWKNSVSNLNALIENWASQTTDKYNNTIQNIINNLNKELTHGLGLEYVNEELSLLESNANNYLDGINSAYAKQKLANKWKDAIDNTDSIYAQKQLNDLMEKQNQMLEEKGKLTQHDIDRAEKEYEIALKQIALQEAQQNKSTMKLQRDANGNYSYQFVSDEDQIRKAQDELAQAQNELYNFDKKAYQENLNEMYSVWDEFQQKIAEAYTKYAGDQDALNEHITLLQEQYGEKINFLTEQNLSLRNNLSQSAFNELSDMYDIDMEKFENMTDTERNLIMNELVPQWDSGVQQMIDKFATEEGFRGACQKTFDQLHKASDDYKKDMDEIRDKNQIATDEATFQGNQLLNKSNQLIQSMIKENERVKDILTSVQNLNQAYLNAKNSAIEATNAAYQYVQASRKVNEEAERRFAEDQRRKNVAAANAIYRNQQIADSLAEVNKALAQGAGEHGGKGSVDQKSNNNMNEKNGSSGSYNASVFNTGPGVFTGNNMHYRSFMPDKFDTGGYTGAWGSSGKLAILDEKELVLNKHDTQNILDAVSLLRTIVHNIGNMAIERTSSLLSNLLSNNVTPGAQLETIEQQVHIDARFEGQTEADQISSALDNLINIAAQRANRKK